MARAGHVGACDAQYWVAMKMYSNLMYCTIYKVQKCPILYCNALQFTVIDYIVQEQQTKWQKEWFLCGYTFFSQGSGKT